MNPKRLLLIGFCMLLVAVGLLASHWLYAPKTGPAISVYTSVDSEFALPIFERFTKETGIAVVPRTDDENSKTTGLVERLLAMKGRPDGDVFWNSELSFTQLLANKGALEPYESPSAKDIPAQYRDPKNLWTGFGARARVIVYNTQKVKREELPKTLEGLADPKWKGKICVAKPLFGTTRSHLTALALQMGEEKAFALFRSWRANGVTLVASNGDVRNRVAEGSFDWGLTDTDDVFSAMDRKKPVDFIVPEQTATYPGAFLIPNTVALLKGAPNSENAKRFIDYLLRPETEKFLAETGARQIPVRKMSAKLPPGLENLKPATVDNQKLAEQIRPLGEKIFRILNGDEK
jgi:iron(III) transport system substrate-binding protein